jgi:hypothetical protein
MFNRRGQSTLEYALIIAVVVAGLLLMQHYVKRGYAGRLKSASDDIGEQYDPTGYDAHFNITQKSNTTQTVTQAESRTKHIADQLNSREGNENVTAWNNTSDLYDK